MERAYSLLEIKSIDEDRREITGIASTIEADHVGDVMEPAGAQFSLPLPFLWQHEKSEPPIGEVFWAKATAKAIEVKARIAKIAEPGPLKDRVDMAWQAIKARLVRGLSVGYLPVEAARIANTGGLHIQRWKWLELSAVTIPMNAGATIANVKSFDTDRSAASGTAGGVSSHRPGASGSSQDRQHMENTSAQLTAKLAELKTKREALEELRTKAADTTPGAEDIAARRAVTGEIEMLNLEIKELRAIEDSMAGSAAPIRKQDTAQRPESRVEVIELKLPPGIGFARMVRCKMAQFKESIPAAQVARLWYPSHPGLEMMLKAAVNPMTTADGVGTGGTALVYAQNLVAEFIEFLRPQTIIGQFGTGNIPSLRRVPFNIRVGSQTSGTTSQWVGQGGGKPVQKFDTAATTLTWAKIAALTVLSDELARFSQPSADALVRDELARGIVERMDQDFVDPTVAAAVGVNPASITNAIAALTPSGTDAAAVRADILQLLTPFITANIPPTSIVFITTNTVALTLSLMRNALGQAEFPNITMRGGTLEGFPVIASQYCSTGSPVSNLLIAAAASEIFLADDGQVAVDVSREASIEMSDDPDTDVGTVVSMFQTNQLAIRCERYVNWALRRAAAVAYLDGVAYVSGSPS